MCCICLICWHQSVTWLSCLGFPGLWPTWSTLGPADPADPAERLSTGETSIKRAQKRHVSIAVYSLPCVRIESEQLNKIEGSSLAQNDS